MPVRNGATHIESQLHSLTELTDVSWELWVSDDGSTDKTRDLVRSFQARSPFPVHLLSGPCKGLCANIFSVLNNPELPKGPLAFCDQDDVWYPNRLARALRQLEQYDGPALYCSRTDIGATADTIEKQSPLWRRPPSFANALIQSIAGANTMVLNNDGAEMVKQAARGALPAFHDWWLYQLFTGAGAPVIYDREPSLFYRQHGENTLGRNRGMAARYARFSTIQNGEYHGWVTKQTRALWANEGLLTEQAKETLDTFARMRRLRGRASRALWSELGLHRQSKLETHLMRFAAARGLL